MLSPDQSGAATGPDASTPAPSPTLTPGPDPGPGAGSGDADGSGPAGRPGFLGWRIAGSGMAIQVIHSGLVFNAFTLFAAQLKQDFGWSNSVFGIAFAMNRAESGLLGPVQGWMTDRFGPRLVLRLGAVVMAIGFLAFSTISTVTGFYLTYLLVALGSSLGGFITVTTAIVNWFEKKRARALAVSSMGFAVGGTLAFAVGVGIDTIGWQWTARLASVVVLVVILPLSHWFVRRPSDIGQHVDGIDPAASPDPVEPTADVGRNSNSNSDSGSNSGSGAVRSGPNRGPAPTTVHFTASEALRTRAFWFVSLGHGSALLVVGAVMAHLANFLEDETDLGGLHVSLVIGCLPAMMGVGHLIGGYLGDRFDKRLVVTGAMFGHFSGFLALAAARGPALIWLFVLLHGLAWGVRGPLQQAIRADYFGSTDFGKIMGFSSLIVMLGMMIGPITAGVIADTTGSFRVGFAVLAVAAGLGSLWFYFARPPVPPGRPESVDGVAV